MALLGLGADPDYVAPDGTSAVQLAMYQQDYPFAAHDRSRRESKGVRSAG